MSGAIANLARGIEEQAKLIESKLGRGKGRRLLEASKDEEELLKYYRRIASLFEQLQLDANLSTWTSVNEQVSNARLDRLLPVQLANYDSKLSTGISRRTCTDGTRIAILAGLDEWSHDENAADIYWMNGMAGTGKTTIACSFSEALESRDQLAASFFCTRNVLECREVGRIIPTIAYQLAQYSAPFQSALCEVLGKDSSIGTKNISKQFDKLLLGPLLKVQEAIPSGLVVTIDALDECDDMLEVESLLSILLKNAKDIPLKFFVTSRPEPEIYERMMVRSQMYRTVMHLHEVEHSLVQADVELYLATELEFVSPTLGQIKALAQRSGTLFIYAATLVRYICARKAKTDSQRRLQSVLSMTSKSTKQYTQLDTLYAAVLQAALNEEELEGQEVENIRHVLNTVICIQEPVSVQVLAALTGLDDVGQTLTALQSLRAVLHVSETSGLVSTLHASFPDFMFDEARSGLFHCQVAVQSGLVTTHCFDMMRLQLRFNICKLESSFVPDSEVKDLEDRVRKAISPALLYTCRYWGHHLRKCMHSDSMCTLLRDFLANRLLFWMEVLNLKREIGVGADIMLKAKQWVQAIMAHTGLSNLVEDAQKFVTGFAVNPVSRSTPHIYISWLPFYPKSSCVSKSYWEKTRGLISVTGSVMRGRETAALATWVVGVEIFAISYSSDGGHIAVGCSMGSICTRNARNGTYAVNPFKGHTRAVLSLAYSPDDLRIVSGSADNTIRFWNTVDGTPVVGPSKGHTGPIWSVAYSPDGARVVSGSADGTIRVWNSHDGTPVFSPFGKRTSTVWAVAYSPNGKHIVSGYEDGTIRVWDALGSTSIDIQFEDREISVLSVAYSLDGAHIVSGWDDGSIRVWNAVDGAPVLNLYAAHTRAVLWVGYSHDGACIVSGSRDCTIQLRNARDGTLIDSPFTGHTGAVLSLACSPDGTCIISGSDDKTIRLWNTRACAPTIESFMEYPAILPSAHPSPTNAQELTPRCRDLNLPLLVTYEFLALVNRSTDGHYPASTKYPSDILANPLSLLRGLAAATLPTDCVDPSSVLEHLGSRRNGYMCSGRDFELCEVPSKHQQLRCGWANRSKKTHMGSSVAFSPDGTHIASVCMGGADVRVWSAHNGSLVSTLSGRDTVAALSIAFSPDGICIAAGYGDHTIRVWNAYGGSLAVGPLRGHTRQVESVAYSPDGACIVSGSMDKTVRVWGAHSGELVAGPFEGHQGAITSVACSPDGIRIISGSEDHTIRVWNMHDGTLATPPLKGHTGAVLSVAYSPTGCQIVSGSRDRTIRLWNADDGTLVTGPFRGHTRSVCSVAYSPDGSQIVSASSDRTIRIWDVCTKAVVIESLQHKAKAMSVRYSADGSLIASSHPDQTVRVWKVQKKLRASGQLASYLPSGLPPSDEGWVTSPNSELLLWFPPDLAQAYTPLTPSPRCQIAFGGEDGSLAIDFRDMVCGERWGQCYKQE